MTDSTFGTFFVPGPTEVRPEILEHMTRPMMGHRGRAFEAMFARIEAGLRDVLLTARPVYGLHGNGDPECTRRTDSLSRQRCILRAVRAGG
jgi:aspartate aminotransferase-like enzyme